MSCISVKHVNVKSTSINHQSCVPLVSECAPRSVHLHLRVGAVPVGTSPSGDAGQHRGEGWGGECEERHTLKHAQRGGADEWVYSTLFSDQGFLWLRPAGWDTGQMKHREKEVVDKQGERVHLLICSFLDKVISTLPYVRWFLASSNAQFKAARPRLLISFHQDVDFITQYQHCGSTLFLNSYIRLLV